MASQLLTNETGSAAAGESAAQGRDEFHVSRRGFVQALGAGLVIAVAVPDAADAQPAPSGNRGGGGRGRGGGGPANIAARVHIGQDGALTVLTGKVECGQNARGELTQAAAEELRVPPGQVKLVMADTAIVPDDGITAGSRTTPSTVPSVRQGCAAARALLVELAARRWGVERDTVEVRDGHAVNPAGGRAVTYADLAQDEEAVKAFAKAIPSDVQVTPVKEWKVLGTAVGRPNARDLVTGAHQFPSDIHRPGILYGKVLRPPSYGAKLTSIDPGPARAMEGVTVVQDGSFVGVVAPTAYRAEQAIEALADTARWERPSHPSSATLYDHLRKTARGGQPQNPFAEELSKATHKLRQSYNVAYVQHAPMEPRAAVAEWEGDKLTVWTGSQNPFSCRTELARTFNLPPEKVRVVIPDFGGGFGGKHNPDAHVEAARLARAAGKPVSLRWTREEEFTWAMFRPAAAIDAEATLDAAGNLTSWFFVNVNSGGSAIETPYRAGKTKTQFIAADAPLRYGSYRALASTANVFARESFMDELAALAGRDALGFRLAHLPEGDRLRAVLEAAAERFDWAGRVKQKQAPDTGIGLACGTEKGSFVASCAEVAVDRSAGAIHVRHVCTAYECGAIINPDNLLSQVQGAVVMALGPALREEMVFENGAVRNASFGRYRVPRFADVPALQVHLLNRPDLPSVGAGETPLIAVAPAIANAVCRATGERIRQMPIRLPGAKEA